MTSFFFFNLLPKLLSITKILECTFIVSVQKIECKECRCAS